MGKAVSIPHYSLKAAYLSLCGIGEYSQDRSSLEIWNRKGNSRNTSIITTDRDDRSAGNWNTAIQGTKTALVRYRKASNWNGTHLLKLALQGLKGSEYLSSPSIEFISN